MKSIVYNAVDRASSIGTADPVPMFMVRAANRAILPVLWRTPFLGSGVVAVQPAPAPGPDAEIDAAISDMEQRIREADYHEDAIGGYLRTTLAGIHAQRLMRDDIKVSLAAVQEARQPLSKEDLNELVRRAVYQMDHSLTVRAISLQRGVVAGAVAAAVALVAIGWLAAEWWRPSADISGMTCQDERGGRVCYMWVTPPPQPPPPR
jgi:hypothetical protein